MSTPPPPPPPPAAAPPPPPSAPPPPPADDRPTLTQIDEYQHAEEMEAQADMFDKIGKQVRDFFKRVGSSRCVLGAGRVRVAVERWAWPARRTRIRGGLSQ